MSRYSVLFSLLLATVFSGCDATAKSDLRSAENVIKEADKVHAEQWAEREYRLAEAALNEGVALNRVNAINEARDKAEEAKSWARQAIDLAIARAADMEAEKDRLGTVDR